MNFELMAKLIPYAGALAKAIEVFERLENDPDVKAALATLEEVAKVVAQYQTKETS